MFKKHRMAGLVFGVLILSLGLFYLSRNSQSVARFSQDSGNEFYRDKSDPGSIQLRKPMAPPTLSQGEGADWLNQFGPLSDREAEEYELVIHQIKNYHTLGKINEEDLHRFRGAVYKYRDRGLAHMGRRLTLINQETDLQDRDSAESLIDQIDALSYFAKAGDPLALRIIENLAKRPIAWTADGSMGEPIVNVLTLQAYETLAKHQPGPAIQYLKTGVNPKYRAAYAYYLRMGLKRSGQSDENIGQIIDSL